MHRLSPVVVLGIAVGLAACSTSGSTVQISTDGGSDADIAGRGDLGRPDEVAADTPAAETPFELPFELPHVDQLADLGPG